MVGCLVCWMGRRFVKIVLFISTHFCLSLSYPSGSNRIGSCQLSRL
jgi:hypothetical protein